MNYSITNSGITFILIEEHASKNANSISHFTQCNLSSTTCGHYLCYCQMRIAVNTRFLLNDYLEGYGYFLFETFCRITISHPEHEFIFLFDRKFDQRFIFSSNIIPIVVSPPARHPLLWKLWFDIKIPAVLKKYKADVFVSTDGFCSLATSVPQLLVVHDLSFLHYPAFLKKSHLLFYKIFTPKFITKAKRVATVSVFSKNDIISQYNVASEKIDVVYSGVKDIFQPVNSVIREQTKKKYTAEKEFFLYTGAIHPRKNLVNLLKAFSIFKKRQQSDVKLLLVGRLAWKYDLFLHDLKTYKYRDDVIMPGYVDEQEMNNIMGSAYALVFPSFFEGFGVPVLEAMKCNIPVITAKDSAMQEIAADAALYADANDHAEIAEQMMRLYKDETLRYTLIKKGVEVANQYNWERTADLLWKSILKISCWLLVAANSLIFTLPIFK